MRSDGTEQISVTVPSDLRYGEATRAMLDVLSKRLEKETGTEGLNAHVISAFNEAFNNVVEHAYGGARNGTIEISVVLASKEIVISLADRGKGFSMDTVEEPELEDLPEGGLGLLIIRSVMSNVEYGQKGDRNVLTMTKEFSEPLAFPDELFQEV